MPQTLTAPPTSDLVVDATPEDIAFFHEHGYVRFERVTTDEELEWIGEAMQATRGFFKPTTSFFDQGPGTDVSGGIDQMIRPEAQHPDLFETTYYRNSRRLAAAILGVDESDFAPWSHFINKPARVGDPTPWHQDEAFWEPTLSYVAIDGWMPLDPATVESGCLHFVPGSHKSPIHRHEHLDGDPSISALVAQDVDELIASAMPVELAPGGLTFHHPRTLHYAGPNVSGRQRRAHAITWQLPPEVLDEPADRPWITEGRAALAEVMAQRATATDGRA